MIEDRDYMREAPEGDGLWYRFPAWGWIIIVNAIVFTIQLIMPLVGGPKLTDYLGLTPDHLLRGRIWELLTFQFLHAGPLHIIANSFGIYMFGPQVEKALGRSSFLKLYFISGVVGGLLQVVLSLVFKMHFGWHETMGWPVVVGASAGVFGLIAAFATLYAQESITTLISFIIPVTMKAKYLLVILLVLAIWGILQPNRIAHAAHLGGMLMGIYYIRQVIHWDWKWPDLKRSTRRERSREFAKVGSSKPKIWKVRKSDPEEPVTPEEFVSKEVDPILDKISQHGIQSLTERERKILEAARKKMSKR